jgi:hypothetical protein
VSLKFLRPCLALKEMSQSLFRDSDSCMQTAAGWPLVARKISMQLAASRTLFLSHLAASRIQIFPGWPPASRKFPPIVLLLYSTGGHPGTICMRLAADDRNIFACASGHYLAKPPVFCKHAARTTILIKYEDTV